ncbi:hypothetical protein PASE110613_00570 [Paenibacillus sediminis]|uniref:Uncharacterized protein n=1 Tax=Paenibacillus sediminis TaxID=664909 RepID=A0ABS4H069_9BACL|nr:hypothetical protein [Paenibacillus sediminis]
MRIVSNCYIMIVRLLYKQEKIESMIYAVVFDEWITTGV